MPFRILSLPAFVMIALLAVCAGAGFDEISVLRAVARCGAQPIKEML
jgi:hypothetical protein